MNTKLTMRSAIFALGVAAAAGSITAKGNPFGQWQPPSLVDGAWEVTVTPFNCATGEEFPLFAVQSYITFASGGTLVEANSNPDFQPGQRSAGLGYWERTGHKTYHAFFQAFLQFDSGDPPPPPARRSYRRGAQSFRHSIEMQDSNHWTSTAAVTFTDPSGVTVFLSGCAKASAERME